MPPYEKVHVADTTLDSMVPVELRADLILELRDSEDEVVLSFLLEAQRAIDRDKEFAWPGYLTGLRSRSRGPVVLLVVTSRDDVAAWAARPIDLGLGLSKVQPLVLGPSALPPITDVALAALDPEVTLLSAMAHGNGPRGLEVITAAVHALLRLEEGRGAVYFQILHDVLREPMKRALEQQAMEQMKQTGGGDRLPPFLRRFVEQGKLEARRELLLHFLARTGIQLTAAEQQTIEDCVDTATLDRWLDNVLGARSAADVFRTS
ncbi:MAG: hypothetical protein U0441_14575 [Polyangiaceae bacterium]